MTKLQTKSGLSLFTAMVTVSNIELQREGDKVAAFLNGQLIGVVEGETVVADGKKLKLASLKPSINAASLIGKDPTTLSHEELVALTLHLQQLATDKVGDAPVAEEAPKASKKKATAEAETKAKPKAKAVVEKAELPEGLETYEDLAELGSKELWKDVVKGIVSELEGITSRSKKDEMLEAAAKYFGLTPADEEEEDEEEDDLPGSFDSEDDDEDEDEDEDELEDEEDDEDEDEEDEDEEDDEDSDDEDEDEDDEDEEEDEDDEDYDEEDEDEDDEDDEAVTPKDVDALFKAGNKKAILDFCKLHEISIPKKKLSADKVKQIIMEALFGDE